MKVTTDACLFGAWAATRIGSAKPAIAGRRMLDIGTGTGLLSLMVAQHCDGTIDAVEMEAACAEQAKKNIEASPFKKRIHLVHANVLQWQTGMQYDCIFSNPPFYEKEIPSTLATKNMAHHAEGLKLVDLFQFIKKHLMEKGDFLLLLPAKREKELDGLLKKAGLFIQQKIWVQQTPRHLPFRLMIQGCGEEAERLSDEKISIKNEAAQYTPAFTNLLKNYYLHL